MIRNIFSKISGDVVVLSNLWGQRQIPYLPEEKLQALSDARLRDMVRYAAETVPYYQNLFQTEKIDPREARLLHFKLETRMYLGIMIAGTGGRGCF